jgi:catechol 2,3-dioxygenase-like lactoylglutathione lyase family enzyme
VTALEFAPVPIVGLHHLDLAVTDVDRSLRFYLEVLGPLGVEESFRFKTYRGSEEVVYLRVGPNAQGLGLRPADGGEHEYYGVGIEHFAILVDRREDVDEAYQRCLDIDANVHHPPEEDSDIPGYWAMFVFDPDGIRLEVAHWPGAATA